MSIERQTFGERGHGVRLKVNPKVRIPGTWSEFHRDSTNKMELFKYLTEEVMQRSYSGRYNYRYVQGNDCWTWHPCRGNENSVQPAGSRCGSYVTPYML